MRKIQQVLIFSLVLSLLSSFMLPFTIKASDKVKVFKNNKSTVKKLEMLKKKRICVGQKFKLNVKGANKRIRWTSSDKRIVRVNKKGIIRGIKRGKAVVKAKVGKKTLSCKVRVRVAIKKISYKLEVDNVGFLQVGYVADEIFAAVSDPSVARVELGDVGFDSEENLNVADVFVYGKKDGKVNVILTNKNNNEKVVFKAIVKKPTENNGKQKLIDYLINYGTVDDLGSLNLMNSLTDGNDHVTACVQYDSYEEEIGYSCVGVMGNSVVEWNLMRTENDNTEYYITMWISQSDGMNIKENFVTTKIDSLSYDLSNLIFEDGWFKTQAAEDLQIVANETTKKAISLIGDTLTKNAQLSWKDIGFEKLS